MSMPPTKKQHDEHSARNGGFSAHFYTVDLMRAVNPADMKSEMVKVGEAEVEFCCGCGYHVSTRCSHTMNEWEKKNTVLRCVACSADVT